MPDITGAPSSSTFLRWTTLVFVAANMAFIAVYSSLSETPMVTEVLAGYGDAFVPAGFAKAICVAILVAFLLFYLTALWPRRQRMRAYDTAEVLYRTVGPEWHLPYKQNLYSVPWSRIGETLPVRITELSVTEEAFTPDTGRGLSSAADLELFEDVVDMVLDGAELNPEARRDLHERLPHRCRGRLRRLSSGRKSHREPPYRQRQSPPPNPTNIHDP
jgi:hypothetical protein